MTLSVEKLRQMGFTESVAEQVFIAALDVEVQPGFKVNERVQFYRKGYAAPGEKDPTLAINGVVKKICPKTGWLEVHHKWGVATVKPQDEKVQILQHKKGKVERELAAMDEGSAIVVEAEYQTKKNEVFTKAYGKV